MDVDEAEGLLTPAGEAREDEEEEERKDADKGTPEKKKIFGAKPKVRRSTEETKQRRRVLRKAHSVSHSPAQSTECGGELPRQASLDAWEKRFRRASLDATKAQDSIVLETPTKLEHEQVQPLIPESTPQQGYQSPHRRTCPEFFGVRSYLHTFYESVNIGNPNLYDDFGEPEYRYLIAPARKRRAACLWKTILWLGINLLAFGLVMILVGYMVPKRIVVVGQEDDMEIIDKTALQFNSNLDLCKLVGLVVFCIGGTILVAVLLFPSLMNQYYDEDQNWSPEAFKVQVGGYQEPPKTPTEKKVPATEELANIQPKDNEDEKVVMTNSGLCKVP